MMIHQMDLETLHCQNALLVRDFTPWRAEQWECFDYPLPSVYLLTFNQPKPMCHIQCLKHLKHPLDEQSIINQHFHKFCLFVLNKAVMWGREQKVRCIMYMQ